MLAREIPRAELARRRHAVLDEAVERGMDGLVIWGRGGPAVDYYGDVLYLTNHFPAISSAEPDTELWSGRSYTALILAPDIDPILITDIPEMDGEFIDIRDIRPSMNVARGVAAAMQETGLHERLVGLVGHHVMLSSQERFLTDALGAPIKWVIADDILVNLRSVKSDAELDLMRKAATVGMGWMSTMLDAAIPGTTEGAVIGKGLAYMAENGGIPADVDISSGPFGHRMKSHFAIPSWELRRKLEKGDILHIDAWGSIGGYYTDTARSTVIASVPGPDRLRVIEGTIALVDHLITGIKVGARASDIFARGVEWIRNAGFEEQLADDGSPVSDTHTRHANMYPYFGHGIGLGMEAPWLTSKSDMILQRNMTLAIEVYFNAPNGDLVGFEENIIVTDASAEVMTSAMRSRWWE